MTLKTATRLRTHAISTDTTVVVSKTTKRAERAFATGRPASPPPNPAEKEADRWVAQMMFENYNP